MTQGEETHTEAEVSEEEGEGEYLDHLWLNRLVKLSGCLLASNVCLTGLVLYCLCGLVHFKEFGSIFLDEGSADPDLSHQIVHHYSEANCDKKLDEGPRFG